MNSSRIESSARGLRRLTLTALVMVIVVTTLGAIAFGGSNAKLGPLSFETGLESFGAHGHLAGATMMIAGGALFAYALWRLSRMLALVAQGEAFSSGTVRHLRAFAFYAFASTAASIMLPPLAQLLIILSRPVRTGKLTLSVDGSDLWALLISGFLFLVARLMSEAQRIADENRMIV